MRWGEARAARLHRRLRERFAGDGIRVRISKQKVPRVRLWRFTVVSEYFKTLRYGERQSLVWRLVRETPDETSLVSIIYTLAPGERS